MLYVAHYSSKKFARTIVHCIQCTIETTCDVGGRARDAAHIVPGGTDKSNGGDYENRLRYVKFGGLAILKP